MNKFLLSFVLILCFMGVGFSAWNVNTAVLGDSLNLTTLTGTDIINIWFDSTGTRLYGHTGTTIVYFDLSTPWDISTISNIENETSATFNASDIDFNPTGTYVFTSGQLEGGYSIYQGSMSTAFNITTSSNIYTGSLGYNVGGSYLTQGGNHYYFIKDGGNMFYRYLTNSFILSSMDYAKNLTYNGFSTYENLGNDIFISPSGLQWFLVGSQNDKVITFNMSQAYNLSTSTYAGNDFYLGNNPHALFFNPSGTKMFIMKGDYVLYQYDLDDTIPFDANRLLIQSTTSGGACPGGEAVISNCTFWDSDSNPYYAIIDDDQTTTTRDTVKIGINFVTKEYQAMYSNNSLASANGFLRPFAPCWDISEVGATGLGGLDYDVFYNEDGLLEGVQLHLRTENMKEFTIFPLYNSFYYKGWNHLLGNDLPVIMAGKYATPISLVLTPEVNSFDPDTVNWGYALGGASEDSIFNDLDGNNIWVNNKFYLALAYNTTDYMLINHTYMESMNGFNRTFDYMNWTDLRVILEAYGVTSNSIDELLTNEDFTTPYAWVSSSNKVQLKGYAWGEVKNSNISDYDNTIEDWKTPSCAQNDYGTSVFAYKCDSNLVDYSRNTEYYGEATFCDVIPREVREYVLTTPGIHFAPYMNSNVTENAYTEETLVIGELGNYTYSCVSEYGETQTGAFTFTDQFTAFPLFWGEVNGSIGLQITVVNRDKVTLGQVAVTVFNSSGDRVQLPRLTNSSGIAVFDYLTANTDYTINLKNALEDINYTLTIGDSRNSGRLGDGTFCSAWAGYYEYTVTINPILKDVIFLVKCNTLGVPDAQIYIDGALKGLTDSNGLLDFSANTVGNNGFFTVQIYSRYGNSSSTIYNMADTTINIEDCLYGDMVAEGVTNDTTLDFAEIISILLSPLVMAFLLSILGGIVIGFKTASMELSLVGTVSLMIMFFFIGWLPISAILIIAFLIAGIFALRIWGG